MEIEKKSIDSKDEILNEGDTLGILKDIGYRLLTVDSPTKEFYSELLIQIKKINTNEIPKSVSEEFMSMFRVLEALENGILIDVPDTLTTLRQQVTYLQESWNPNHQKENTSLQSEIPENSDLELLGFFYNKCEHDLEEIESHILEWEKQPSPQLQTNLLGLLHGLKGESGVLGLNSAHRLLHETESYLQSKGLQALSGKLLKSKDVLFQMIQVYAGKSSELIDLPAVLEIFSSDEPIQLKIKPVENFDPKPIDLALVEDVSVIADFITESNDYIETINENLLLLEENSRETDALNSCFRAFHTIKGVASFLLLEGIRRLAHASENLLDFGRQGKLELSGHNLELIIQATKYIDSEIKELASVYTTKGAYANGKKLGTLIFQLESIYELVSQPNRLTGTLLVGEGKISPIDVKAALEKQKINPNQKIGEILVEEGKCESKDVEQVLNKQNTQVNPAIKETIKVTIDRITRMVDTIGELVIAEAMITKDSEFMAKIPQRVLPNFRQLTKITRELQEIGMSMRMISLKSTFQKMARLIRDLSTKTGKEVKLIISGEDTELDRTVVEKIGDPLMHMIRNSMDHGMESSIQERMDRGKSPVGTIELNAYQKAGYIYIEIKDDGRGLDAEKIKSKAVNLGWIKEDATIPETELFQYIFKPGFSTAEKVTDVSGRGVGMDVVRKNVELLHGSISIISKKNVGTTFMIQLPLTVAIVDGLVVRCGDQKFIIPTLQVSESVKPDRADLSTAIGCGEMLSHHDRIIPLFRLSKLFHISSTCIDPTEGVVIIVEDGEKKYGLLVDAVMEQQQVVIKNLGVEFGHLKGVSGGAILADGNVSLILDPSGLALIATQEGKYT